MIHSVLQPRPGLRQAGRIGTLIAESDRIRAQELAMLVMAGGLAAVTVAFVSPGLRIPGSAILRAALPIVCGVALVPRRMAGSIVAIGAALASCVIVAGGWASLQPAAWTGLLALGPAIDMATAGNPTGWRLYLRFALAGVLANSLAFAARAGASWLALDSARPHNVAHYGLGVFLSFAACGAAAGLLSAAVCFRFSAKDD